MAERHPATLQQLSYGTINLAGNVCFVSNYPIDIFGSWNELRILLIHS